MGIAYPVALDSDYAIWRAFTTTTGPPCTSPTRRDISATTTSARAIRGVRNGHPAAAARGRSRRVGDDLVAVDARGFEAHADWANLASPETYLGYERTENFASPGGAPSTSLGPTSRRRVGAQPLGPLRGLDDRSGAAMLNRADGRIAFRFHARDVHLVLGPAGAGTSVPFRVLIDGHLPAMPRTDVDDEGHGRSPHPRLYQLSASGARSPTAPSRSRFSPRRRGLRVHLRLERRRYESLRMELAREPRAGYVRVRCGGESYRVAGRTSQRRWRHYENRWPPVTIITGAAAASGRQQLSGWPRLAMTSPSPTATMTVQPATPPSSTSPPLRPPSAPRTSTSITPPPRRQSRHSPSAWPRNCQ